MVKDSDPNTWSTAEADGNVGFYTVTGYYMDDKTPAETTVTTDTRPYQTTETTVTTDTQPYQTTETTVTTSDPDEFSGDIVVIAENVTGIDTDRFRNNAKKAPTFTVEKDCLVIQLQTFHYNNGNGKSPGGAIALYEDGKLVGMWQADTNPLKDTTGKVIAPNGMWFTAPDNIVLKKGHTYTIDDSDRETWTCLSSTGYCGMFGVYGIYSNRPDNEQTFSGESVLIAHSFGDDNYIYDLSLLSVDPQSPTSFTVNADCKLDTIITYHKGKDAAAGRISLYEDGVLIGEWDNKGYVWKDRDGNDNGNTSFAVFPENVILRKGKTYTIKDSETSTWFCDEGGSSGLYAVWGVYADSQSSSLKGDANLDGKLNVRDAAFIASKLAKGKVSELPQNADYNGDGKINVRDCAAIAKFLAKK